MHIHTTATDLKLKVHLMAWVQVFFSSSKSTTAAAAASATAAAAAAGEAPPPVLLPLALSLSLSSSTPTIAAAAGVVSAFPLTPAIAYHFLLYLARDCEYAMSSVVDVYSSSLKRLNRLVTGKYPTPEVYDAISQVIRVIRNTFKHFPPAKVSGRTPLLRDDIINMCDSVPPGHPLLIPIHVMMKLMFPGGMRAITVTHIKLKDIHLSCYFNAAPRVVTLSTSKEKIDVITLNIRVVKNDPYCDGVVNFAGTHEKPFDELDPIFWLGLWLKAKFGLDLAQRHLWKLTPEQREKFLLPWSEDGLNMVIKMVAVKAGYPEHMFSSHSHRAAMAVNAVGDNIELNTAQVGHWVAGSKSQRIYFQKANGVCK